MKRLIIGIALLFTSIFSFGQSSYIDSMSDFQSHYKKELYAIIKNDTAHVRFYPVHDHYRVTASVEKLTGQKFFPMATSSGVKKQAIKYLKLTFQLFDGTYTLYAYQLSFLLESDEYKDNFFIPFRDGTSGSETYEGGRYIDFKVRDITANNKLVIDFNKSYNPYCAFNEGYACPIPPKENTLTIEIRAGEKSFDK